MLQTKFPNSPRQQSPSLAQGSPFEKQARSAISIGGLGGEEGGLLVVGRVVGELDEEGNCVGIYRRKGEDCMSHFQTRTLR